MSFQFAMKRIPPTRRRGLKKRLSILEERLREESWGPCFGYTEVGGGIDTPHVPGHNRETGGRDVAKKR